MGTDMYCFAIPIEDTNTFLIKSLDDLFRTNNYTQIKCWRNNKYLHNWMHRLFQKSNNCEEFNLVPVQLTKEDILNLEQDILTDKIISAYTDSSNSVLVKLNYEKYVNEYNEKHKKEDLDFIREAKIALEDNKAIYYYAWY